MTSYNNFKGDHKTIVSRVGSLGNNLTQHIKEKLTFDKESHLRQKIHQENQNEDETLQQDREDEDDGNDQTNTVNIFSRRFNNQDMDFILWF